MNGMYERINELLKKRNMTKKQLAQAASIPYSTLISAFNRSSENMSFDYVKRMATALEVGVYDLIDWDSEHDTSKLSEEVKQLEQMEKQALELFRGLNCSGQAKAMEYLRDISQIPEYINKP